MNRVNGGAAATQGRPDPPPCAVAGMACGGRLNQLTNGAPGTSRPTPSEEGRRHKEVGRGVPTRRHAFPVDPAFPRRFSRANLLK